MERFCFKQDESSHWYMVPVEKLERFDNLLYHWDELGYKDEYDAAGAFDREMGQYICQSPSDYTFANPESI